VDVLLESGAQLRAFGTMLMPVPRQWRALILQPGAGPIVLLVGERGLPRGSMASLGHRLARDLDASIHLEPRGGGDTATRATRVAAHVLALAAEAPDRAVLIVGHGAGGLVARRAATTLRLPILRVVTLATPHCEADEPDARDPLVDRIDVVNIYSLHDARIDPPERAYLAGAFNVALRDHGHFGLLRGERPYTILCESLADLAPHAAAS
jgi:pimeloyl-ACP methyl ester carboxylesterase